MTSLTRLSRWDVRIPAVLLGLGLLELLFVAGGGRPAAALLQVGAAAALVFRRRHPLVVAPLAVLCMIGLPMTGTEISNVATPIFFVAVSIYSLGRYVAGWGGAVAVGVVVGLALVEIWHGTLVDPTDVVFLLSLAIPPYAFGRIARRMAEQSEQLVRQQAQLRDQAVQEERDRIARDLHDVLAHSLSSMVVQTAAAQDLVRTDPDRAEDLLTSAAETGRAALDETGRLLHLVRGDSGEQPGLAPAPGLSEVGDLVAAARLTGLDVEAELDLPERPLPGAVDVFGYRVVQEALTNATRYADGRARLEVSSTATGLRICCSNPVSTAHGPAGSGLGLQGVAERVELLGGTLSTRHGDGTHTLDVEIPLPGTAPS